MTVLARTPGGPEDFGVGAVGEGPVGEVGLP